MAYGLTKSAHIVSASSQSFTKNSDLGISSTATIEGWIKVTSSTNGAIFGMASGISWYFWLRYNKSSGALAVSAGYTTACSYTVDLDVNTWYHVAVTRNGSTYTIFLNGTQVASGSVTDNSVSTTATFIGKAYNASEFFDGDISLVRVWNVVRTGSQMSTNQCSVLGSTTNLVAEWTLDDTLNDNSGNSNTLTNNNTVTFTTALSSTCVPAGPQYLKTFNGLLKASIKTIDGVAIANIKTVDGVA